MLDISDFLERRTKIGKTLVHFSAVVPVNGDLERTISGIARDYSALTPSKLKAVR